MKTYKLELCGQNPFSPIYKIDLGEIRSWGSWQLIRGQFSFEASPELANEFYSKLQLPHVTVSLDGPRVFLSTHGGYDFDLIDDCLVVGELVYHPTLHVTETDEE